MNEHWKIKILISSIVLAFSYGFVYMLSLNLFLSVVCVVTLVTKSRVDMLACKKCGTEHEKPTGNKCERFKMDKEEKKDNTKEQSVKKTPKNKPSTSGSSQDKMMELMLTSMSSVTEKLAAMEERITGLTEKSHDMIQESSSSRKSRSREKSKKRESSDERQNIFTTHSVIQSDTGIAYSKVFPDTAVALKHTATPARVKKLKNDADLGVAPLSRELIPTTPYSFASLATPARVTSTITRPIPAVTVSQHWETTGDLQNKTEFQVQDKQPQRDFNQNILLHTDQYGNPVQVQAMVEPTAVPLQPEPAFFEKPAESVNNSQSIDALRANPMIQKLVEERVAVLESRMRSELQQGTSHRRKSGRYNIAETPHNAPHLRWPNESCFTGTQRKRTPYDDLSLGQFVVGYINNVLDVQHVETMKHMLTELGEVVKLAENLSWPIARGAFAVSMHKIEEEAITWTDRRVLADNRLTYSQSAVFSGSVTMSPRPPNSPQIAGGTKKIVCKWYNENSCPHNQDHYDTTGTTLFKHVCMHCFKNLKRNNAHRESDCLNKNRVFTSE